MLEIYDEPASEELSDYDSELENFIVVDEEEEKITKSSSASTSTQPLTSSSNPAGEYDENYRDRILDITNTLKPNESMTQKVLKAHISVLVSALGGPDHTSSVSPPPYKLGHDALACLKDIKRWIKAIDERTNVYDVALACADSGLLVNDLLVILCQWEMEQAQRKKSNSVVPQHRVRTMEKIMLSCLELLVLLTWPLELTPELTPSQRTSYPNLKKVQLTYKKEILAYQGGQTLKAVIRLILPIISKSRIDREARDNAIIRMALFFIRNILFIEPANTSVSMKSRKEIVQLDNLPANVNRDDISISAVISSFKKNKVLVFLLTITGSLGTEFDRQMFGNCALECIYLLVRGIKPEKVYGILDTTSVVDSTLSGTKATRPETDSTTSNTNTNTTSSTDSGNTTSGLELQKLLATETKRKQLQNLSISTRHGRFGSLISIDANSDKPPIVVSGQEGLLNTNMTLEKLDSTKKWHSRTTFKYDADNYLFKEAATLISNLSMGILREFLDQFLASGSFNNLISCVSWLLTSSGDLSYTDAYERACYFLVVSWFFHYKREVPINKSSQNANVTLADGPAFGSVGEGLSETNFVLLLSYFRLSYESKDWNSLHVAMICLREMLLISLGIFKNIRNDGNLGEEEEADRELAEGIIHKLFESKSFLDLIIEIPKTAAKHSPDYLNVCLSVVHIVLKTFESFANEDIALYVKAKRRQSKNKKKTGKQSLDHSTEMQFRDLIEGSEGEEDEITLKDHAKIVSKERRLDFKDTELRFFHPATVSTYIEYLSRYEDLSEDEIKRCLSYFHRLFVVRKDFTNLYRLDFMNLLHKLRSNLPRSSRIRESVDEFIYYFMKKFKAAMKRFPLAIELLFPRIEDPEYRTYLGAGDLFIKPEKKSSRRVPRLGKDLEFIRNFTIDEKFKIIITILVQQEKETFIGWFRSELERIVKKRLLQDENEINMYLQPNEEYKRFLIGNSYVRVLVSLVGFELPYIMEEQCLLTPSVTSESVCESIEFIKKWLASQPVTFEDGMEPTYYLRVKEIIREEENDDEFNYRDGDDDFDDESIAFETNAPAESQTVHELDRLDELEKGLTRGIARVKNKKKDKESKKKPLRKKDGSSRRPPKFNVNSDDEESAPKGSKSSEFVHDSDDDSDDEKENEFFEREERLRRMLEESGGIVNPTQLLEFKKAWSSLESTGGVPSKTVSNAIEATLFVEEDGVREDKESSDTDTRIGLSSQTSISPEFEEISKKRSLEDNVDENVFGEDEEENTEENVDSDVEQSTRKKKRLVIDSDDE